MNIAGWLMDYYNGSLEISNDFLIGVRQGQRKGQAFFNALRDREREILRATDADPFYRDDRIEKAMERLTASRSLA